VIGVLWRRLVEVAKGHHITTAYLCVMVTFIVFLLLTASPVETCK